MPQNRKNRKCKDLLMITPDYLKLLLQQSQLLVKNRKYPVFMCPHLSCYHIKINLRILEDLFFDGFLMCPFQCFDSIWVKPSTRGHSIPLSFRQATCTLQVKKCWDLAWFNNFNLSKSRVGCLCLVTSSAQPTPTRCLGVCHYWSLLWISGIVLVRQCTDS